MGTKISFFLYSRDYLATGSSSILKFFFSINSEQMSFTQYIRAGRHWIRKMQLSRPTLRLWFWLPIAIATRFWSFCSIEVPHYQCPTTSGIFSVHSHAWSFRVRLTFISHLSSFSKLPSNIFRDSWDFEILVYKNTTVYFFWSICRISWNCWDSPWLYL